MCRLFNKDCVVKRRIYMGNHYQNAMQNLWTKGDDHEEELSHSLSNFHRFFIVMSEEVKGLVRLHGFSSIYAEVKHCNGERMER